MNYFDKNRLIIGIVIFITVINLAALGTVFYMVTHNGVRERLPAPSIMEDEVCVGDRDRDESVDSRFMDSTRKSFRIKMIPIHNDLKRVQSEMMEELSVANPDSVKLDSLAVESSLFYLQMKKRMINDFVQLNRKCDVQERQHLNCFYKRYMVEDRREMGSSEHDDRMQRHSRRTHNSDDNRKHRNRF